MDVLGCLEFGCGAAGKITNNAGFCHSFTLRLNSLENSLMVLVDKKRAFPSFFSFFYLFSFKFGFENCQ